MADYIKTTNFAIKDTLTTGDPNKKVKGTEIDVEFTAIQTAVSTKLDKASPTMTGVPTAPTPDLDANTTQIPTTKWVRDLLNVYEPVGTIKAFAGSIGNVPVGWAVCDGNNGTVNLKDRFIVGFASGGNFAQNTTGGHVAGSLTIPLNGTTVAAGSHTHTGVTGTHVLTVDQIPSHTHGSSTGGAFYTVAGGANVATGPGYPIAFADFTAATGGTGGHNHSLAADGAHAHSLAGASATIPGFFALMFIQKTALL